ncbi:MAG: IS1182 family transposase [Caldisericaceae bacterium]|nr:IS1182 family transposase [Caldisericaceae bacterium]
MTERTFRPYDRDQMFLLPPSLKEWLPEGHLSGFVADVIDTLDLRDIWSYYGGAARGTVPFNPRMLVTILVYSYCVGVFSSRKIAKKLEEDVAFRVLAANQHPNFRTISDFRKAHLKALGGLFKQVFKLCQKAKLVKLGNVALDGTKIQANASKHKAMSYDRMEKEEERLTAEIEEMFRQAQTIDEQEDEKYGSDRRGDELPAELAFRKSRLKKIQEAKVELEREAKEKADAKKLEQEARDEEADKKGPKKKEPNAKPEGKAQKNFTDPESRIMPASGSKGSFVQGYNCQAAVDSKAQIIVAADVTQETNDKKQAEPMMEQVIENAGETPKNVLMDAGYFSKENVEKIERLKMKAYIPPNRMEHGKNMPAAQRGRAPKTLSADEKMRRKLRTKRGHAIYAMRKGIVEPVFGQIKHGRGFRQFLLRGAEKVKGEWSLICITHNILKLWKSGQFKAVCEGG